MADNTTLPTSDAGGDTIATDDISGVKFPRSKIVIGANGTNDGDVAKANPLPIGANTVKDGSGTVYAPLVDSDGHLQVDVLSSASHAVTNAGTFVVQENGSVLTALQLIDNVIFVDDADWTALTSSHALVGGIYQSTPGTITDGDTGPIRLTANGAVHAAIQNTVTVASHAVTNAGTFAVQVDGNALTALQLLDDVVYADDADWTDDTSKHALVGGLYQSSPQTITDGDVGPIQLTSNGYVIVSVNGTVTVGSHNVTNAGTFAVQAAQSGTWNIGTVTTVTTVSAVTNVATIGTSITPGTSAAHLGKAEDAAHSSGDTGVFVLAVRSDTAAATGQTDGDYTALVTDSSGRLHVNVGNTVAVASHAVTNAGTFAVQVDGSALTALQLIDDVIFTDDNAFTPGTSKVAVIGAEADETSPDSVDEGDAGALRMTLDRQLRTVLGVAAAGGASIFRSLDLDETEEDVKTSPGQLYGYFITNLRSSAVYIKFYNATAANVTVGSTTPVLTIPLEADQAANVCFPMGIAFDTAICVAATTGLADADTGAPGANEVVVNIFYK